MRKVTSAPSRAPDPVALHRDHEHVDRERSAPGYGRLRARPGDLAAARSLDLEPSRYFTTRPPTPPLGATLLRRRPRASRDRAGSRPGPGTREEVRAYVDAAIRRAAAEERRDQAHAEDRGAARANGRQPGRTASGCPMFVRRLRADAVSGTGALMAVPAHDQRDHGFARCFRARDPGRSSAAASDVQAEPYVGDGPMPSSGGLRRPRQPRRRSSLDHVESAGVRGRGRGPAVDYRLRDSLALAPAPTGAASGPRSCTARPAGCSATVPDDQLPVRAARRRGLLAQGPKPAGRGRRLASPPPAPAVAGPARTRDRHDGHLRRLVLVVLPRAPSTPATTSARRTASRESRLLDADRPVHRRGRGAPIHCTCSPRAFFCKALSRTSASSTLQEPFSNLFAQGIVSPARAPRCRSRRAARSIRPSTSSATAPTPCAPTSASSAPRPRRRLGRTRGSRGSSPS